MHTKKENYIINCIYILQIYKVAAKTSMTKITEQDSLHKTRAFGQTLSSSLDKILKHH